MTIKQRLSSVYVSLKQHTSIKIAAVIVGVVLSAIIGAVVNSIWDYARSEPGFKPYIAVVVSKESVDFPIPGEFLRGFQDGGTGESCLVSRDNRKVDIRPYEDLGSVEEAARIANVLVQDENCVLVIGNSDSTLTAATLDGNRSRPGGDFVVN